MHYYEDGNVQLFSDKEISVKVQVSVSCLSDFAPSTCVIMLLLLQADYEKTAKEVLEVIADEETKYQVRLNSR